MNFYIQKEVIEYEKFSKMVEEKGLDGLKNYLKKEGKEYIV